MKNHLCVIRRKSDGLYANPTSWKKKWVESVEEARIYRQVGHAKQANLPYGGTVHDRFPDGYWSGKMSEKERAAWRKERFDALYEVVRLDVERSA